MLSKLFAILAYFALSTFAATCQPLKGFKMTFYGFPDNDPPGPQVRYDQCGNGGKATGDGSYAKPLTFAAAEGRFAPCTIIYSPFLKKYLRLDDSCANCSGDWVDVWLGSTTSNGGSSLLSCQNTLTGSDSANHAILVDPPSNLPVSAAEVFDGKCNTQLTFPSADANPTCGSGAVVVPPPAVSSPAAPKPPVVSAPAPPVVSAPEAPSASVPAAPTVSSPSASSPANGALTVSVDGSCGASTGFTCQGASNGPCCSRYGQCGNGRLHCRATRGCQAGFGKCK